MKKGASYIRNICIYTPPEFQDNTSQVQPCHVDFLTWSIHSLASCSSNELYGFETRPQLASDPNLTPQLDDPFVRPPVCGHNRSLSPTYSLAPHLTSFSWQLNYSLHPCSFSSDAVLADLLQVFAMCMLSLITHNFDS